MQALSKSGLKFLVLLAISAVLTLIMTLNSRSLVWEFQQDTRELASLPASFQTVFAHAPQRGEVHAPAIIQTELGFALTWFQGSHEARPDVQIFRADFHKSVDGWTAGKPAAILSPSNIANAITPPQTIILLGNTIQYDATDPARYLVTIVSLGGWAMASLADVRVEGGAPKTARRLNLSPLLNRSHLVKAPTLRLKDGDLLVPAYFEMGNAYGELIRIGPDGHVRDKSRISWGKMGIQPVIVAFDGKNAVALQRNFDGSKKLVVSRTSDGGAHWSTPELSDLPNPNAPVAAITLSSGQILLAFNDDATRSDILRLALSADQGITWRRIATLEDHKGQIGTSTRYPMMQRLPTGEIALVYSARAKHEIRAHVFTESWVLEQ